MLNHAPQARRRRCAAAIVLCTFVAASAQAEIVVITDSAHPVQLVPGARLINLDEPQRIKKSLFGSLPANPQQAAAIARQRLDSPEGTRAKQELLTAQQGVADAWSLGIAKIPAVVVDRKFVVYGQPNVAAALQAIQAHRSTP